MADYGVHLLPADRADHRVIDGERVCRPSPPSATRNDPHPRPAPFAVLADPTRLTLLTCISAAGPISVSDLAAATGITTPRSRRPCATCAPPRLSARERDGRMIRYQLADASVAELLAYS